MSSGGAATGQAMSARPSWGFRLPVWRSKADKLAQALGDYTVERGRVAVTPFVRWNSWGVVIEISHFMRGDRHIAAPLGELAKWNMSSRIQIGPCVFLVDATGSYVHKHFRGSVEVDEHAAQAMPSGAMRPIRMAGSSGRNPAFIAGTVNQVTYPPTNKFTRKHTP